VLECLEHRIPFIASNAAAIMELVSPADHARVLFDPTDAGIADALRRTLANGAEALRPARRASDDAQTLRKWREVIAVATQPRSEPGENPQAKVATLSRPAPHATPEVDADWIMLLEQDAVPEAALLETLVRAQEVSGADVVSCGVVVDGTVHLFPGEPRGLGLLANGYGTTALVRRSLLDHGANDRAWSQFAKLSVSGAKIVSVPTPLVTESDPPATLNSHPGEALVVLRYFERALPHALRFTAELSTRLAAQAELPAVARRASFVRRAVRRLRRVLAR
jgi:hypothetical protein